MFTYLGACQHQKLITEYMLLTAAVPVDTDSKSSGHNQKVDSVNPAGCVVQHATDHMCCAASLVKNLLCSAARHVVFKVLDFRTEKYGLMAKLANTLFTLY